jgi:hypothetical protein
MKRSIIILTAIMTMILIILLLSIPVRRNTAPRNLVEKVAVQYPIHQKTELDMNMADITKINTYDRVDADLDDWEEALRRIRDLITMGELSSDGDEFQEARRKCREVLDGIQQTRAFIAAKRSLVPDTSEVEAVMIDGEPAAPYVEPEGLPEEL